MTRAAMVWHVMAVSVMAVSVMAVSVMVCNVMAVCYAAEPSSGPSLSVEVELGDGTVTAGRLERIDAAGVRLSGVSEGAGTPLTLPAESVRTVRRAGGTVNVPDARPRVVATMVDGSTLSGDDFAWDGRASALLIRPEGRIEMPAGRVRSLAWSAQDALVDAPAAWQKSIPEGTEKDLVVVGTDENHEFVECAIMAVSADTVTVQLEEETIPVKRSKVIGLRWLRDESAATHDAAGRVTVNVPGGSLRAARVEWSADGLVVDEALRLPAAMLSAIDYAAGRLVPLVSLTAEKVEAEPWFGGLVRLGGRNDAFSSYFAPRAISAKGGGPATAPTEAKRGGAEPAATSLIMRPRTVAVWRLPPDSRRFRAAMEMAAGPQASDATQVSFAVDDREVVRRQFVGGDDARETVDIDLTSGRRLTVMVDFGAAGGIGGAVLLTNPVIER